MQVLVACEFSGIVRDAFIARGHDAWSCDLEDTEVPGPHLKGDVLEFMRDRWDLMIAHPPCTFLANSGALRLYQGGKKENGYDEERLHQAYRASVFFNRLLVSPIRRICIENPIMHGFASEMIGVKYSQIVHPYWFGHPVSKATCLWLKYLPPLKPTKMVEPEKSFGMELGPNNKDRAKIRSRTFEGLAKAMARQWG